MSEMPISVLYVLRHAHSAPALPGQRDDQRPLDDRGRADALRIGVEIVRSGYRIESVVCSTAVRAQETLAAIRDYLPPGFAEASSADLYELGAEAYYAKARGAASGSLLLIGHNPTIEEFTASVATIGERRALDTLKRKFPTAGLAVIEIGTALAAIEPGAGYLRRLVHPREL